METKIYIRSDAGFLNVDIEGKYLKISDDAMTTFVMFVLTNQGKFLFKVLDCYSIRYDGSLSILDEVWDIQYTPNGVMFIDSNGNILTINNINKFYIEKYKFQDRLGIVHWGGKYRLTDDDYLIEGAKSVKSMGIDNFKIYIGPKSDKHYFNNYGNKSPVSVARQDNYRKVFMMGFKLIVIVCHSKTSSEWRHSDDHKMLENETEIMRELAVELGKYPKTQFIITNWEGDCMINKHKDDVTYDRLAKWVQARQNGVDLANQPNVKHGIEVNFVKQSLPPNNQPSVLTEVVPKVRTDYISYSCYDCCDEVDFESCVRMIYTIGRRPIIVGEFGTPVNFRSSIQSLAYIQGIISVAEKYHIRACFYWQIYENEFKPDNTGMLSPMGFGLIGPDSRVNGIWAILQFF